MTDGPTTEIAVVYYSGKGHTRVVAESFADGVASVDGCQALLFDASAIGPYAADDADWQTLAAADAIVFGTPTYIGSVAAGFKAFVEKLNGPVWLDRLWTGKLAAGFTVSAGHGGDKFSTLSQLVVFAAQMGMIWVPVPMTGGNYSTRGSDRDLNRMAGYLGTMAQANSDEGPDRAPPESDRRTAEIHGEFLARTARQIQIGREREPLPDPAPWSRRIRR